MRRIAVLSALALLGIAAPARAQDFTAQENWGEIARGYHLPPAEALAREGVQAVRVFAGSGLHGPMPAVIIARPPHGPATITTISVRKLAGRWEQVTRAERLSDAAWRRLFATATGAMRDRRAVQRERAHPVPRPPETNLIVCSDPDTDAIELIDHGRVVRAAEILCDFREFGDLAAGFAHAAVAAADPACAQLPAGYGGDFIRIRLCNDISGDLPAAVSLLRHLDQRNENAMAPDAAATIVADWPGRHRVEGPAAFAALEASLDADIDPTFSLEAVHGDGPSLATATGDMFYRDKDSGVAYTAPCTQVWALEDGHWRLERLSVGVFVQQRPAPRIAG